MRSYIEKKFEIKRKKCFKNSHDPDDDKKESKNKNPVKATNTRPKYIGTSPALLYCIETMIILPQTESKEKEKNCEKHTKQNIYPLLSRFVTTPLYL